MKKKTIEDQSIVRLKEKLIKCPEITKIKRYLTEISSEFDIK
jgi:hypothetical protein